jgi:hypothetical protein
MQNTTDTDRTDLAAMFEADFGETVAKICEAVTDLYGPCGAQMLARAINAALNTTTTTGAPA